MTWPDLIKLLLVDKMHESALMWAMLASLLMLALVVLAVGVVWALRPVLVRALELRHRARSAPPTAQPPPVTE